MEEDRRISSIQSNDEKMHEEMRTKCQKAFLSELHRQGGLLHIEPREGGYSVLVKNAHPIKNIFKGSENAYKKEYVIDVERLVRLDLNILLEGKKTSFTIGHRFTVRPKEELSYSDPLKWLFPIVRDEHDENILDILRWKKMNDRVLFSRTLEEINYMDPAVVEKWAVPAFRKYVKENYKEMRFDGAEYGKKIRGRHKEDRTEVLIEETGSSVFLSLRVNGEEHAQVLEIVGNSLYDTKARKAHAELGIPELVAPILERMRDSVLRDQASIIQKLFV